MAFVVAELARAEHAVLRFAGDRLLDVLALGHVDALLRLRGAPVPTDGFTFALAESNSAATRRSARTALHSSKRMVAAAT